MNADSRPFQKLLKSAHRFGLPIVLLFSNISLPGQPATPLDAELAAINRRVDTKMAEGKRTEADYAAEIADLERLMALHSADKTELTKAAFAKARLRARAIRRTPWMPNVLLSLSATPLAAEFAAIEGRIGSKLAGGSRTEADLAPEIAEIDRLLSRQPERSEDAAMIAHAKMLLYLHVFRQKARAAALNDQLMHDYPDSAVVKQIKRAFADQAEREADFARRQSMLVGGPAPEIHFEWAARPDLQKLSDLKGRVVVVDFWATWCGPCIASFPALRQKAARFADRPVTFLGVTSLQGFVMLNKKRIPVPGEPDKEYQLTAEFAQQMEMTWDVVFSREKVFNPEYAVRGIPHVAIIAPDGTVRHNGLNPLSDAKKIEEQVEALLEEFNLTAAGGV